MAEYNSGVKFDSKQAERNVDSFASKIGRLRQTMQGAKSAVTGVGSGISQADKAAKSAAVNVAKLAQGTASFARSGTQAANAARALSNGLAPTKLATAARALRDIATTARGAATAMSAAARSAGSLVSPVTRATSGVRSLSTSLRTLAPNANRAARAIKEVMGSFGGGRIPQMTALFRSLNQNFAGLPAKFRAIASQVGNFVRAMGPVGTAANKAGVGIGKVVNALERLIPKLSQASIGARNLQNALASLNGKVQVSVTGANSLGQAAEKASNGVARQGQSARRASNDNAQYEHSIKRVRGQIGGMLGELVRFRNIMVYVAAGLGIGQFVEMADTMNLMAARMRLVTDTIAVQTAYQRRLLDVSARTRTDYEANAKLFTKLAMAGKTYGVTGQEALRITENIGKAMKISGATTAETTAATLQLSQAFSSGRLQGDELRSVLENSPRLAQALAEELKPLGFTLANIRKKAKEGELGIKEMRLAFGGEGITKKLDAEFKKIPVTISDALKVAKLRLMEFIHDMDTVNGITPKIVAGIGFVADHIKQVGIAALFAAGILAASYIPALLRAATAGRAFIALQFASAGAQIAGGMTKAATGTRMFGYAMQAGLPLGTRMGALLRGVGFTTGGLGGIFRAVFTRFPALIAIGVAALALFDNKTKVVKGSAGELQDFLVVGFATAFNKINTMVDASMSYMANRINETMSQAWSLTNFVYRVGAAGIQIGGASLRETAHLVPGGARADFKAPMREGREAFRNRDLHTDIGNALRGSKLDLDAQDRAMSRTLKAGAFGAMYDNLLIDSEARRNTVKPPKMDTGGKKKGGKSDLDAFKDEWKAFKSAIDPVEKDAQVFAEGLRTIEKAQRLGLITGGEYKKYLDSLAKDTFPGLKDQIRDLADDNADLRRQLAGGDDTKSSYLKAADTVKQQIETIDKVIAKDGDRTGQLAKQKQALVDQLDTYGKMVATNQQLNKQLDYQKEKQRQISELIDNAMNRLQEAFVNAVKGVFNFNGNYFKNQVRTLANIFKETFSSVLGNAIFGPMQDKLRIALEKAFTGSSKTERLGSQKLGELSAPGITFSHGSQTGVLDTSSPSAFVQSLASIDAMTGNAPADKKGSDPNDMNTNAEKDIVVTGRKPGGFFEEFAKGYKKSWSDVLSSAGKVFKPVGKALEKAGVSLGRVGNIAGKAFAGAQMGATVAGIGKMLGIKTSTTGGMIGGALGSAFGPIGQMVGSVLGSVVGGLFKKTKTGSVSLSTSGNGYSTVGTATGNNAANRTAATQAGNSVMSAIQQISDSLGGFLVGNLNLGSIGKRKDKYTFDPTGNNRTKGSGVQSYATEEEASRAALLNALQKGVVGGLSPTADRLLRNATDPDRALQLAGTIEDVKRQALTARDPFKGTFQQMQRDTDKLVRAFREAGASAEDYADLQAVVTKSYKDALDQQLQAVKEFRDSLKVGDFSYLSPVAKLAAAKDKFSGYEAQIAKGDFSFNQADFTNAGTNFLQLARQIYGSTPEFAQIQARLLDATNKVVSNAEATAEQYKPVVDAIGAQTQALINSNQNIIDAISGLQFVLGGGSGGSFFSTGNYVRAK